LVHVSDPPPARARISGRKKLLFVLVPLVLAGVLGEGLARVYVHLYLGHALRDHHFGGSIYEACPDAYNRLRPGSKAGEVEVNTQGLVGQLLDPSSAEVRVVALGGSTTFFRDYLSAVREDYRGPAASFAAAGTPGYTLSQSLANLRRRIAPLRPQVLVVYHGVNDLIPLTLAGIDPDDDEAYRSALTSLGGTSVNRRDGWVDRSAVGTLVYNRLLGAVRARRQRSYTSEDAKASLRFARDLRAIVEEGERLGAVVVLVTLAHAPPRKGQDSPWGEEAVAAAGIERHAGIVRALAVERGLICVDAAAELDGKAECFVDLCHFSDLGRDRLADLVRPALRGAVESLRR
jgi:hypothetical protein